MSQEKELIDDRELARRLKRSRGWLQHARLREGAGPPFFRIGKSVVYDWAEVLAWLEANRSTGGAQ